MEGITLAREVNFDHDKILFCLFYDFRVVKGDIFEFTTGTAPVRVEINDDRFVQFLCF